MAPARWRTRLAAEMGRVEVLDRAGKQGLGYLSGLYAGALAMPMPSLCEGFGLPCLEGNGMGEPVVAADRGALSETCRGRPGPPGRVSLE
jgi:glycosyltransferase involved in cell wall biosynthesis